MIVSRLIGGLGNQMFQYSVVRALSQRTNANLFIDVSGFAHYNLRRYELGEFNIKAQVITERQLKALHVRSKAPTMLNRMMTRLGHFKTSPNVILREASFTYDDRIESALPPVYLDGYWQSEKYFARVAHELRSEFSLRDQWNNSNAEMAAQIQAAGAGAVSLHIRRGDYVSNEQTAQYHGVCSLDYYRSAISHILGKVARPHFFVFSDDHAWAKNNLQIASPTTFVQVNSADNGIYDMMLMKTCRHHIIANSSFSWWGAWLNPHEEKVVVAPRQWFKQSTNDTRDLIPASWIRL